VGLPPNYTIFGMLAEGADVLDALAKAPVTAGSGGERSKPAKRLVIDSIEIRES
jgi:cyclophilin family peptidyl-prolyl cis-trans isomerase